MTIKITSYTDLNTHEVLIHIQGTVSSNLPLGFTLNTYIFIYIYTIYYIRNTVKIIILSKCWPMARTARHDDRIQ
jgi:hypothetical protein